MEAGAAGDKDNGYDTYDKDEIDKPIGPAEAVRDGEGFEGLKKVKIGYEPDQDYYRKSFCHL